MPKSLTQLTIFISGPSDTDADKSALRRVIEELSRRLEKTHSLTLRAVGWPDDVRPGVNTDTQAEVNRQVGSSYDIYVGLIGPRFGTPTPRSGSGTAEELELAVKSFRADPRALRVLLYFKRAAGDPFAMDLEQLAKVKAFREALPARGILYRDFNDTAEFIGLVNEHLYGLIVDEWRDGQWADIPRADQVAQREVSSAAEPPAPEQETNVLVTTGDESVDDADYGLLEYMEAFHAAAAKVNEAITLIASCSERIGERMRSRTAETTALQQEHEQVKHIGGSRLQQDYLRKAREVVDGAASDLDEFVSTMNPAVDAYRSAGRDMFGSLRRAISEGTQLPADPQQVEENRRALENLIQVMDGSRTNTMSFQASVRQVPALTGKFKRSRQHAASTLGNVIAELSFGIDEAKDLLRQLSGGHDAA